MSDFLFVNHGSVTILTPQTPVALEWIRDHIPEDAMRWGADGVVIEPRYARDILDGIAADGLTVTE